MPSIGEKLAKCSDDEFIRLWTTVGPTKTARRLGQSERSVYKRRISLEAVYGPISSPQRHSPEFPDKSGLDIKDGFVLVGSDFHIWPGEEGVGLRAFKKVCSDVRPDAIILNGDVCDFPQLSRFESGWEHTPSPVEEIEAAQDHLNDIVKAGKRGSKKIWTIGNHDIRFERTLAERAPEYKKITGIHLSDHFPVWEKAMACWINGDIQVKHRHHNGIHAAYNNTLKSGVTVVTGHLHAQQCIAFTDLRGTRYGVDTGVVQSPWHKAFEYLEGSTRNWRSGFALLQFRDGKMLYPEFATVWDENSYQFRGSISRV